MRDFFQATNRLFDWLLENGGGEVPLELAIRFPHKAYAEAADRMFQSDMMKMGIRPPVDRKYGDLTVSDPNYVTMLRGVRIKFEYPAPCDAGLKPEHYPVQQA